MNSSLQYTKRLVGFMVFDQEGAEKDGISSLDEEASMANLREGDPDDPNQSVGDAPFSATGSPGMTGGKSVAIQGA